MNQDSPEEPVVHSGDRLPMLLHDMGNQLTVILGFAEMLLDEQGELPPDTVLLATEAIVRNAREMRWLLEAASDIDLSRPPADDRSGRPEAVEVGPDPRARR